MKLKETFFYSTINDFENFQKNLKFDNEGGFENLLMWSKSLFVEILNRNEIDVNEIKSTPINSNNPNVISYFEIKTLNTKENYKLYICILNIDQRQNLVPISPILPGEFKEETIFILKSLGENSNSFDSKLFFSKKNKGYTINIFCD